MSDTALHLDIVCADIIEFGADVVALKYAQDLYGADRKSYSVLGRHHQTSITYSRNRAA